MTPSAADAVIRVKPPEFRGPGFDVVRNNIYKLGINDRGETVKTLVGQLEEQRVRVPLEQAARLLGGSVQATLAALSAAGSVASIVNLGVSVVGFIHVSRALKRVEARLGRVELKLDAVAELVGVIDQKVDQLLWLGDAQVKALAEVRSLMLSFQTASVHRALETLDLRAAAPFSPHRDGELLAAARTLHDYRIWLAQARESDPARPAPVRVELLRAEVLTAVAEARARMLVDDADFASLELERVLVGARSEVGRIREEFTSRAAVPSLLSAVVGGLDMHRECTEAWAWLDGRSVGHATRELLRDATRGYNDLAQRITTIRNAAFDDLAQRVAALGGAASAGRGPGSEALARLNGQGLLLTAQVSDADAASFVAAYRLARSLEGALQLTTAIAIGGPPVRALLAAGGLPGAPALVVELERVVA